MVAEGFPNTASPSKSTCPKTERVRFQQLRNHKYPGSKGCNKIYLQCLTVLSLECTQLV